MILQLAHPCPLASIHQAVIGLWKPKLEIKWTSTAHDLPHKAPPGFSHLNFPTVSLWWGQEWSQHGNFQKLCKFLGIFLTSLKLSVEGMNEQEEAHNQETKFCKIQACFCSKDLCQSTCTENKGYNNLNSSPHANRDLRASPATQSSLHNQCICEV